MNDKYSDIESDEFMYYHINVFNSQIYEQIEKYMDIDCENENLDNSICCRVLNFMADELNVKNGVWSQGQKRKEYEKILLGYELPQDVIDYFDKVNHLWTIGGCTSRVKMMYKMFENKI